MNKDIMDDAEHNLYRVAGAIVLTPVNLDAVDRQDILDSILLAQLFSKKRHGAQATPEKWIRACIKCLSNLNWTVASSNSTLTNLTTPFSAASAMSAAFKPQEADLAKLLMRLPPATRRALKQHCIDNSKDGAQIRLSIAIAYRRGEFQLKSLEFASSSTIEGDWIHQEHHASVSAPTPARLSDFSFYLTEDFESVRDKVIKSLGGKRAKEIQAIDSKPVA